MNPFEKNIIKEYKYWVVNLHNNQGYLGRCVVWCKRENASELMDVSQEEKEELFFILAELRDAVNKSFQPDWFNYCFLGNIVRHLHCHLIPRYEKERKFGEVTFKDKRWGQNYRTDENFKISERLFEKIKDAIKKNLEK